MIRYIYDNDEFLVPWAAALIGRGHRLRPDAKAIGIEVDGEIRGVVVFDTFCSTDCLMSVASDSSRRWITREFIGRALAYPFIQLHFPRVTCLVSERNLDSVRFVDRFGGWVCEGVLRKAGDYGEDMLLYGMLREDCPTRWLSLPPQPMAV